MYRAKIVFFQDNLLNINNIICNGYAEKDIAIIKIQPNINGFIRCNSDKTVKISWKYSTLFCCIHEIAHMFGLIHCSNKRCIMGVINCKNYQRYCMYCISNRKVDPSKIFCKDCYKKIKNL